MEPDKRLLYLLGGITAVFTVALVTGAITGLPAWLIALLGVGTALGVVGTGVSWGHHRQLEQRRRRLAQIDAEWNQLTRSINAIETDPTAALNAPEWVEGKHPVIREFTAFQRQATRLWDQLRGTDSVPTPQELTRMNAITQELQVAHLEAQRASRALAQGEGAQPDGYQAQLLSDSRWNQQFRYPTREEIGTGSTEQLITRIFQRTWPVPMDKFIKSMPGKVQASGVTTYTVRQQVRKMLDTGAIVVDANNVLWPASVDPDQWAMHRSYELGSHMMFRWVVPEEIANVMWLVLNDQPISQDELFSRVQSHMRFLIFTPGNKQQLRLGLDTAIRTRRVAINPTGALYRGRDDWPVSYRQYRA